MDAGNGFRVLIVEDEWLIAETLASQLTKEGFVVIGPAAEIREALDLLSTQTVDCAVLDVSLGEQSSFSVADALQDREVPFVFVTGYTSCDIPRRFKDRGLLMKPVDPDSLSRALAEMCNAAASTSATPTGV
jgi:CheY-like chemotaxis protein